MTDNRLTRKEALRRSMEHWRYNYRLARKGKLQLKHIKGDRCALCTLYSVCVGCPLHEAGYGCEGIGSPWRAVDVSIKYYKKDVEYEAHKMFTILRDLYRQELEKEK